MPRLRPRRQVEEIVENGELDPDQIHIPSVFVNRVFKADSMEKRIEVRVAAPWVGRPSFPLLPYPFRLCLSFASIPASSSPFLLRSA